MKTETDAQTFGAEQGFEDLFPKILGNSGSRVDNPNDCRILVREASFHPDGGGSIRVRGGPVRDRLRGIVQQVDQTPSKPLDIEHRRSVADSGMVFEIDAIWKGKLPSSLLEERVQPDPRSIGRLVSHKIQEIVDDSVAPFEVPIDPIQRSVETVYSRTPNSLPDGVETSPNGSEGVPQFMADRGHHLADGRQPLLLRQFPLDFLQGPCAFSNEFFEIFSVAPEFVLDPFFFR